MMIGIKECCSNKSFGRYVCVVFGQAGWILAKFFFYASMDLDFVLVHKYASKERGQYAAILTEQA